MRPCGATRKPDPVLYVVPLSHILGKLPLVPAEDDGTIPRHMHGHKEACYPLGMCDRQGVPGSGSPLFYINSWAMIWPVDYKKGGFWEMSIKQSFLPKQNVSSCALVDVLSTAIQFYCPVNTCMYCHVQAYTSIYYHLRTDVFARIWYVFGVRICPYPC